jgi:flavin-binding protein dodecin
MMKRELRTKTMERTYKKIEIVGISETSFAEATQNAVAKACQSLRHVDWFEVTDMLPGHGQTRFSSRRSAGLSSR